MTKRRNPAEPADDRRLETLAGIARILNERFPPVGGRQPVSRQLLHKAWKNRHSRSRPSQFPADVRGEGGSLFWLDEVVRWYTLHRSYRIEEQPAPEAAVPQKSLTQHNHEEGSLAA
jgi:hypothetical protein